VLVCAAWVAARAAVEVEGGFVIPVRADDDHRDRGAHGAVLASPPPI
jgi:hypothetical protein